MRLHLPKALLAAVLTACLAWPAGAFTSTTTNYPTGSSTPTTFNGDIWTWNNSGTNIGSGDGAKFTNYSTGTEYAGNASNTGGPTYFYNYFFNGSETETDYLGNTLRFSGATENKTLITDWSNYVWIGGIITEAGNYSYTLGRDGGTNFKLNGQNAVNMIINSSFTFKTNSSSSVAVEKGGTWSIAKGKSLTFDTGTTTIAVGQMVNVSASGDGTENASLTFSGAVTNNGTLNIGSGVSMTASGILKTTTINNEGSVTITDGTSILLERLLTNESSGLHTSGSFELFSGNGAVELEGNHTYSFLGNSATVNIDPGNKGGTATFDNSYYYIAGSDTISYDTATSIPEGGTAPAWITVSENGTLSLLPSDTVDGGNRTSNVGTAITGSGTIGMNAGSGQVTIAADKLTDFTGRLLIESGRFNEIANGHVFSNVTVQNGGQFFIEDSCNYNGNVSIAGTGWNGSGDQAATGALRLGNGAVLSGTLNLASDANVRVHAGGTGKIASSANWTNKVTKVGDGQLWLTGSVNIGDVDVSAGTFSLGKLEGPKVASQQIAVGNVSVANRGTFAVGYSKGTVASVTLAANATLRYYDNVSETEITNASDTTNITSLRVNAAANLRADWKGTLNISELTGAGNLALSKTENSGNPYFYLNISSIKDYSGTITGPTSNVSLMTVTIGGANISDAAGTATVSANVTLRDGFTKTGAGAISFGGTTNATDVTVSSGSLTFAGGTSISKLSLNGGTTTISGATTVGGIKENGIIAANNTIKLTISDTGTLTHEGFKYTGTELSGLSHGLTMGNGNNDGTIRYNVIVSGGSITQTDTSKDIYAKLSDVKLINTAGKTSKLGVDANLSGASISGTLEVGNNTTTTIKNSVTGSTDSSIATLTGSGTLKTTAGETSVTNASGFSGTLESTGGTLRASGSLSSFNALKATGGDVILQAAEGLSLKEVVVSSGSSVSAFTANSEYVNYSVDNVNVGDGGGSLIGNLTINNNGTLTFDASAGTAGTGLALSYATTFAEGLTTTTAGSLTLGSGLTLNLAKLGRLATGESLTLFSGVTEVIGLTDENLTALEQGTLAAETVFNGVGTGNYNLRYSGNVVSLVAQKDTPEPTTATLSLLALMALAARRRRKA